MTIKIESGVGTGGGGLNLYDRKNNRFIQIKSNLDLSGEYVNAIVQDRYNTIWFSTNNGIFRLNPDTYYSYHYSVIDGLPTNEFNSQVRFVNNQGLIYFGCINGVMWFDPFKPQKLSMDQPIVLTAFSVFDKPLPIRFPPNKPIKIRIKSKQNFISFEFAALSFIAPEKIQYAYKLDGF